MTETPEEAYEEFMNREPEFAEGVCMFEQGAKWVNDRVLLRHYRNQAKVLREAVEGQRNVAACLAYLPFVENLQGALNVLESNAKQALAATEEGKWL